MDFLSQALAKQRTEIALAAASAASANVQMDSATVLRTTLDSAAIFDQQLIKREAMAIVGEWAGVDPEEAKEDGGLAFFLLNMLVGIADADKDGELTDDEQEVVNAALNAVFEYLVTLGVEEGDAEDLLSNWGDETASRVQQLVAANLPDGAEAEDDLINAVVFTPEDQDPVFDSATNPNVQYDAAYKKVVAIRKGKKVRINKRIAGVVKLSARQKVALRKARAKSHNAGAMARRAKSMRLRKSMSM